MARASFFTVLKVSGDSTAFASPESMTSIGTDVYQIDDPDRRIWDRTITPDFYADGVLIDEADIENIDYLFGTVTFSTTQTEPITVDTSYIPLTEVAEATDHTFSLAGDVLDDTSYDKANANGGYRTRVYGLRDINISLTRFANVNEEFIDAWTDEEVLVLEHRPIADSNIIWRGWFIVENADKSGTIDDLENVDITLQLDGDVDSSFSMQFE